MLKRTLLTMTALSSLILISPAFHDTAMAGQYNKPMIRMVGPQVRVRIDTRRLVIKAAKKPTGNEIVKAGPQPEPPTRPKQTKVTNITKQDPVPLPRSRPYNEFEEEDGFGGDIDPPITPTLEVPRGFDEIFTVFGGVQPDFEFPAEAIPEFPGAGWGDTPFPGDGDLGRPRFGASMDGPPVAPGPRPNDGGKTSTGGWVYGYSYKRGDQYGAVWTRQTNHGTDTWDVAYGGPDGEITITIVTHGPNKQTTTTTIDSRLTKDDTRQYTKTVETEDGVTVEEGEGDGAEGDDPRGGGGGGGGEGGEGDDGEGDGGGGEEGTDDTDDGQPAPTDDATGGGDGGCGVWTPFGGCTGTGPKIWETTGQPDPSGDGTGTTRSAGASIGPEAVTNPDEIHSGSGGGGVHIDPCIAAGDDCGNGPDNPTASMGGLEAAGS